MLNKWYELGQTEQGSRKIFMLLLIYLEIAYLAFFTVYNFFAGGTSIMYITLSGIAALVLVVVFGSKHLPQSVLGAVMVGMLWAICILLSSQLDQRLVILWSLCFPLAAVLVMGFKRSLPLTVSLWLFMGYMIIFVKPEFFAMGLLPRILGPYSLILVIVTVHDRIMQNNIKVIRKTQEALVESEKLAYLGGLVNGVAHEINTPLGNSITTETFLHEKYKELIDSFINGTLTRSQFNQLDRSMASGWESLNRNLLRTADLVAHFKQLSLDKIDEEPRLFQPADYLGTVFRSFTEQFVLAGITLETDIPDAMEVVSVPGLWASILTGLIQNTIQHAFPASGATSRKISVKIRSEHGKIVWVYSNNGLNIPRELHGRIFEPFMTTARGRGHSGLGLSILHNIITGRLQGSLVHETPPEGGVRFVITFLEG